LKKLAAIFAVLAIAASLVVVSFESAEARRGGNAAFFGGLAIGALALGAVSAQADEADYEDGQCYPARRGAIGSVADVIATAGASVTANELTASATGG